MNFFHLTFESHAWLELLIGNIAARALGQTHPGSLKLVFEAEHLFSSQKDRISSPKMRLHLKECMLPSLPTGSEACGSSRWVSSRPRRRSHPSGPDRWGSCCRGRASAPRSRMRSKRGGRTSRSPAAAGSAAKFTNFWQILYNLGRRLVHTTSFWIFQCWSDLKRRFGQLNIIYENNCLIIGILPSHLSTQLERTSKYEQFL